MRGIELLCWGVIAVGAPVGMGTAAYHRWTDRRAGPVEVARPVPPGAPRPTARTAPAAEPPAAPAASRPEPTPAERDELRRLGRAEAEAFVARRNVLNMGPLTPQEADLQREYEAARRRWEDFRSQLRAKYGELPVR